MSVVSLGCFFEESEGTVLCVRRCDWQAAGDPPCSFALAPISFHLFGTVKKHLAGKLFPTDADVKQAVSRLHTLGTDVFCLGATAGEMFNFGGVWCVPSATRVPSESIEVRIQYWASDC